jgi:hypothetical protein
MGELQPLDERHEAILMACLEAMDGGDSIEACLARYPDEAEALRPYLELHVRFLRTPAPEPPASAYVAGRQALIERLQSSHATGRRGALAGLFGWLAGLGAAMRPAAGARLAKAAAMAAVVFVLAGSALGAAAASGVEPAQEVLSALGLPSGSSDDGDATEVSVDAEVERLRGDADIATDVRPDNTPVPHDEVEPPQPLCVPEDVIDASPALQDYGVPVCTEERVADLLDEHLPDEACLPEAVFERFPALREHEIDVCTPDRVVDLIVRHLPDDACLPEAVFERFPVLREVGIPVCPTEPSDGTDVPTAPPTPIPTPLPPLPLPTIEVPEDLVPSDLTDLLPPSDVATPELMPEEPVLLPESESPATIEIPEEWNLDGVDSIAIDVALP